MKILFGFIVFLSITSQVHSEEIPEWPRDVLSAVTGYQDHVYYRAVLVQGEEVVDLHIFIRQNDILQRVVYAHDVVVTGIGGEDSYLTQAPNGALQLVSGNSAIGRHRWMQKLTIVYRDGQFLIGGYTYSYYDTIELDEDGDIKTSECDLNLLTGHGIKNGHSIRTITKAMPVQDWTVDRSPAECVVN